MSNGFPDQVVTDGRSLRRVPDEWYVEVAPEQDILAAIANLGVVEIPLTPDGSPYGDRPYRWVRVPNQVALATLRSRSGVVAVNPVYRDRPEVAGTGVTFRNQVVVEFDRTASDAAIRGWLDQQDATVVEGLDLGDDGRVVVLALTGGPENDAMRAARELQAGPVRSAEPDWGQLHPMVALSPGDPLYDDPLEIFSQWNLRRALAHLAWETTTGDPGVKVAIIDMGFEFAHADLDDFGKFSLLDQWPPGDAAGPPATRYHGTWTAGVLGAPHNDEGISGVAPGCPIIPIRLTHLTPPLDTQVAHTVRWAVNHGAKVINMSLIMDDAFKPRTKLALAYAEANNVVIAASTGNAVPPTAPNTVGFPASWDTVLAVGASDYSDRRAIFPTSPLQSQYGIELDVVAPGLDIATATETALDAFGKRYGTSLAAPHVAGLAALIRSAFVGLTAEQVREAICRSAERVHVGFYAYDEDDPVKHPFGPWTAEVGYGRIDMLAALRLAAAM
jgi:subtilisin family serine protease